MGIGGFYYSSVVYARYTPSSRMNDGYELEMRKIVDGCGGFVLATALLRMRNQFGAIRTLYLSELPGGYAPYS